MGQSGGERPGSEFVEVRANRSLGGSDVRFEKKRGVKGDCEGFGQSNEKYGVG